jgi:hypothetical protein
MHNHFINRSKLKNLYALIIRGLFLLVIAISATVLITQTTHAAQVSTGFVNFIKNANPSNEKNTRGFATWLTNGSFATEESYGSIFNACTSNRSYQGSIFNYQNKRIDGSDYFKKYTAWILSDAGVDDYGNTFSSSAKSTANRDLMSSVKSVVTSEPGMNMENTQNEANITTQGLCSFVVKTLSETMKVNLGDVAAAPIETERQTRTSLISVNCIAAFNAVGGTSHSSADFVTVLNGLSEADFNSKVTPNYDGVKQVDGPGCSAITEAIKAQIQAFTQAQIDAVCANNPNDDSCKEQGESTSNCKVEGIGWIICPVVRAMGGMADATYGILKLFMNVQPLGFNTDNELYRAWAIMRNLANVAFVIVFLIIIFSQLTSAGVSNYGVKKLLPRLIIGVILVNLSYFMCAIAVDVSNIAGSTLYDVLTNVSERVVLDPENNDGAGNWGSIIASILTLGAVGFAGLTTFAALSSIGIWAALAGLLPLLVSALFALIIAFLVLLARQGLIVILIVIAPIAFIAYLLPNTESWFKKWQNLLVTLLALFPMMAIVFGGSAIASTIIRASGLTYMNVDTADDAADLAKHVTGFFLYLGSLAILAIPLFITPVLIKLSSGVLNRFAGLVNNKNVGPFDRMKKGAERVAKDRANMGFRNKLASNSRFGKVLNYGARRRSQVEGVSASLDNAAKRASTEHLAQKTEESESFRNRMAGGTMFTQADPAAMQRALAGAKFTIEKAELEDVKAEQALIANFDTGKLKGILDSSTSSSASKAAALDRLIKISKPSEYDKYVNQYGNDKSEGSSVIRSTMAQSLAANGPKFLKASDIDNLQTGSLGGAKLQDIAGRNVASGVLSQEKMVDESNDNLHYAFESSDLAGQQRMVNTAAALRDNDILKGKIKHNASSIENLSMARPPIDTPPTPSPGP